MAKCPYCGTPLAVRPHQFDLAPKRMEVFMAILNSGAAGTTAKELCGTVLKDKSPTTLRTAIHAINDRIRPFRVVSRGCRYKVVRL